MNLTGTIAGITAVIIVTAALIEFNDKPKHRILTDEELRNDARNFEIITLGEVDHHHHHICQE